MSRLKGIKPIDLPILKAQCLVGNEDSGRIQ